MLELGFVYKLTNKNNGLAYIGETVNLYGRIADHFNCFVGFRSKIKRAIAECGVDSFDFEVLEICLSREERKRLETEYIRKFNTIEAGYNSKRCSWTKMSPSDRAMRVRRMSDPKYRMKMSEVAMRQWADPVYREKIRLAAIDAWKIRKLRTNIGS